MEQEIGDDDQHAKLVPVLLEAVDAVRDAYAPFVKSGSLRQASDTLVTKVLLGTVGCLPACDRFFILGFKSTGLKYSCLNARFIDRLFEFCGDNRGVLGKEQAQIKDRTGMHYPLMKLVDMYFWQVGRNSSA